MENKNYKRYTGNINLDKIKEAIASGVKPFEGKKGTYIPISIYVNEQEDQYGNSASITIYNKDSKTPFYLGNYKLDNFIPAEERPAEGEQAKADLPF